MVIGKTNEDTIQMAEFMAKERATGQTKKACRFYVDDAMRPNTVAIFGNMHPVYKIKGQYYLKVKGERYYNGSVFIFPFDTPMTENGFNIMYEKV